MTIKVLDFVCDGPRFAQPVAHRVAAIQELHFDAPAPGHCFNAELVSA